MFKLYLLGITILCINTYKDVKALTLNYEVTYVNSQSIYFDKKDYISPYINVQLTIKDLAYNHTKIALPTSRLGQCYIKELKQLAISSNVIFEFDANRCLLNISKHNLGSLHMEYDIVLQTMDIAPYPSPWGADINDKFFHFATESGLAMVLPNNDKAWFEPVDFYIKWNLPNENYKISNFYGNHLIQTFTSNLYDFWSSTHMGGEIDSKVVDEYITINSANLHKLNLDNIIKFINKVFPKILELWGDNLSSPYEVNIIAENNYPQDNNISGIGGEHSLSVYLYRATEGIKNLEISNTLIHEIIHKWINDGNINFENALWFTEGFTEYFARRINLLYSQSLPEYVHWHNKVLDYVYTAMIQFSKTNSINSQNYSTLSNPYFTGYLLASNINYLINSNDKNSSLVNVMRTLNKQNKQRTFKNFPNRMDLSVLYNVIKPYDNKIVEFIKNILTNQAKLSAFEGELGPCVKLKYLNFKTADYGFDYLTTINTMIVTGVDQSSPAYIAGLRDGQKVHTYQFTNRLIPEVPLQIQIADGNELKTILINRKGKTIKVPQFELDQKLYLSKPKRCLDFFQI